MTSFGALFLPLVTKAVLITSVSQQTTVHYFGIWNTEHSTEERSSDRMSTGTRQFEPS